MNASQSYDSTDLIFLKIRVKVGNSTIDGSGSPCRRRIGSVHPWNAGRIHGKLMTVCPAGLLLAETNQDFRLLYVAEKHGESR